MTPQAGAKAKNAEIKAAAASVGVRFVELDVPAGSTFPNDVHLNTSGYATWMLATVAAVNRFKQLDNPHDVVADDRGLNRCKGLADAALRGT